jgi:hypothetical protein
MTPSARDCKGNSTLKGVRLSWRSSNAWPSPKCQMGSGGWGRPERRNGGRLGMGVRSLVVMAHSLHDVRAVPRTAVTLRAAIRAARAERLVTELMKRKNDGEYRPPDRTTVGFYLTDKWLPAKRTQLRPSRFDSYRRNIDRHVIPAIGRIPLQRLTPEDLDGLYTQLAEDHAEGQRALAPKTIHSIHEMLHKALADAERKGSIIRNVAALADPPKLSSAKKHAMRVWDADQLREFLSGIQQHRLYPAYYLAANTGMRRGEVLGLRWRDVDLDARRLSVHQAVISVA